MMKFELVEKDPVSKARAGILMTDHGQIDTPIFMPVGTVGSVKTIHQRELKIDIGAQIILGNTYHLYLRPGVGVLHQAGGLHRFMGWDGVILTDSGGFQVHSLSDSRKITDDGVRFKSHIDGSYHFFSPERVMEIQRLIGGDIIMAFDECTSFPCSYAYAKNSMGLTHRWLKRCVIYLENNPERYGYRQSLFPIVQGSVYPELRRYSAEMVSAVRADGNAIGGLSVGEPEEQMYEMIDLMTDILPADKPRYLMGVGTPANILEGIALGVDMFDCVMPTRNARNGMLFTWRGIINIKNRKWVNDFSLLDEGGSSYVDKSYSRAYVRHLFASGEYLGKQIASIHNLAFYLELVRIARKHLLQGDFSAWKRTVLPDLLRRL